MESINLKTLLDYLQQFAASKDCDPEQVIVLIAISTQDRSKIAAVPIAGAAERHAPPGNQRAIALLVDLPDTDTLQFEPLHLLCPEGKN